MPVLKTYNPNIVEGLRRLSRIAGDDIGFLEQTAANEWQRVAECDSGAVTLKKKPFLQLHPAVRRLLLRRAIETLRHSLKDIEAGHIEDMMALTTGPTGKSIDLPSGLVFEVGYDSFVLRTGNKKASGVLYPELKGEHVLTVPGTTRIPGWVIIADTVEKQGDADEFTAFLDADNLGKNLTVRKRQTGDRFQPLGMPAEKKVGQFMIDARIPRHWRALIPLVCDGEKVVWVVGYRIDERVKISEKTKRVLRLRFERLT
jgi:tRNA(Ile)-lysidine synthase